MRKLLLSIAFLASALVLKAQSLNQLWYSSEVVVAGSGLIPSSNTKGVGSIAYDKTNGNLYLAERGGEIYIIKPDDYDAQTGQLKPTAYASTSILKRPASFNDADRFYKVRVADDGAIYATGMRASANNIHIYRWDNVLDQAPVLTVVNLSTNPQTGRTGDSFAVYGTGNNTKLYVSSTSTATPTTGQFLHVLSVNNEIPALQISVDLDAAKYSSTILDVAKGAIAVESESVVWVKSFQPGVQFKRIELNLTTGGVVKFKNYSAPNANYTYGDFINNNGTGILLAGSSTSNASGLGLKMSINRTGTFGVEPAAATEVTSAVMPGTYVSSSGYGDFATRINANGTTTIFFLVNKNGLIAYQSDSPLPVTLTSFNASLVNGQSTLSWQTTSEARNKGFEVLRSNDNANFLPVGFVNSKAQNGHSSETLNYSFVDRTAKSGENYYQLRQIDLDGGEELFEKVVSVKLGFDDNSVVAFPNPTTKYVTVSAGATDYTAVRYELFDVSGKRVLSENAKAVQQQLSLSNLPSSIYYLRILKNNELQKTVKLIKQ